MQAHGQNRTNYAHGIFDDLLSQQIFDVKKQAIYSEGVKCLTMNRGM